MKGIYVAVAVTLVLLAASWGWLQRTRADGRTTQQAMAAFTDFFGAENSLHRAVLSARAGSLKNYDPLVAELDAMQDALARLKQIAPTRDTFAGEVDALTTRAEAEEALVERFKSTNALLHNSLAYFSRLSEDLDGTDPLVTRQADGLATAVLHVVVDPSPAGLAHVDAEIARMEPIDSARHPGLSALIGHARQLRLLLPDMDATLASLADAGAASGVEPLRAALLARQATIAAQGDAVRLFLYAIALVLVGLLAWAGVQLRARIKALHRRAAVEHVVATISLRFLNTPSWKMEDHLRLALEELAHCFGATRAYFIVSGTPLTSVTYARGGPRFPANWSRDVLDHMEEAGLGDNGVVHIEDLRVACVAKPANLACSGIASWLCIARIGPPDGAVRAVLGFDSVRPRAFRGTGADQLLALAFDALTNALDKRALEEERGRLESQLQHARRMETVGVFASGIAHNFNNIVGAIMGHAEMAAVGIAPGSRLAGHIDAIHVASERARQLVDQVLGFGRRSESMRRPIRVDRLLDETVSLLETSLPTHARLVVERAPDPFVALADPGQLQQIVLNLCRNAAEAMDGDGTVTLATRRVEIAGARGPGAEALAPGSYVVISVEDDGRGMDEAMLARIFEPFFTTRPQGNGLGLATAREIAREHRGAISVESTPGAGSRFEVWLPAAPLDAISAEEPAESRTLQTGAGETVMLVERDERQRMRFEEVLAALGYEPVAFADWARAADMIRAAPTRFDAAVIFFGSSIFPGANCAEALHEAAPRMPIILSLESARQFDTERLTHAGIAEVIPYPPTTAQLADALATRLGARRDPRARLGLEMPASAATPG